MGIHSRQVAAGVIVRKKLPYDLWSDTVNTASRFEASSSLAKIHVSQEVKDKLGEAYTFEDRGIIELKGKGKMASYFLLGKNDS